MVDNSKKVELLLEGRTVRFNITHQTREKKYFHSRDSGVVQVIWSETVVRLGVSDCYLSGAETNHQVGDEGVFRFSGAVAHHHAPAVLLGQLTPKVVKQGGEGAVAGLSVSAPCLVCPKCTTSSFQVLKNSIILMGMNLHCLHLLMHPFYQWEMKLFMAPDNEQQTGTFCWWQ